MRSHLFLRSLASLLFFALFLGCLPVDTPIVPPADASTDFPLEPPTDTSTETHFTIDFSFLIKPSAEGVADATALTVAFSPKVQPASQNYTYAWNFGDLSSINNNANPTHTFANYGSYSVSLTVSDSFGKQQTVSHTVELPIPLGSEAEGVIRIDSQNGFRTTFSFESLLPPENSPITFEWDFGDGTQPQLSGENDGLIEHFYLQPGRYTINLYLDKALPERAIQFQKEIILSIDKNAFNYIPEDDKIYLAFRIEGNSPQKGFKQEGPFQNGVQVSYAKDIEFTLPTINPDGFNDKYQLDFQTMSDLAYPGFDSTYGLTNAEGNLLVAPFYIVNPKLSIVKSQNQNVIFQLLNFVIWDIATDGIFGGGFDHPDFVRQKDINITIPMEKFNPETDKNIAKFVVRCVASIDNPKEPCQFIFEGFEKK